MPRPTECKEHRVYFAAGDQCPVCEGAKLEQERIIKLLEDDFYHYLESSTQTISKGQQLGETVWVHAGNCEGCHLIALIKGEAE